MTWLTKTKKKKKMCIKKFGIKEGKTREKETKTELWLTSDFLQVDNGTGGASVAAGKVTPHWCNHIKTRRWVSCFRSLSFVLVKRKIKWTRTRTFAGMVWRKSDGRVFHRWGTRRANDAEPRLIATSFSLLALFVCPFVTSAHHEHQCFGKDSRKKKGMTILIFVSNVSPSDQQKKKP